MNRIQVVVTSLGFLAFTACFSKDLGGIRPGAACIQNSGCVSNLCMGQTCCLTTCGSDATCKGTSCDANGACVYPTGGCGTATCDATTNQLTTSVCSQGACVAGTPAACPGHLTCANSENCRGSCSLDADCVSGFSCSSGTCLPQVPAGASCTRNDGCTTGICGVAGSGHCCSAACLTSDSHGCGATDCDTTGACVYPAASTLCVPRSCLAHTLTEPARCDGQGSCAIPSPATADCEPYQCGANATCAGDCGDNAGCSFGFCHLATRVCCAPYAGNQLEVDGTQGQDVGCCGGGNGTNACATIAYAVSLVGEIASPGITVHVANPPDGTNWTGDTLPIQLSFGVVLNAPGLDFSGDAGATPIFTIQPFGSETTTSAVLEGSAAQPISIGIDSAGNVPPLLDAIVVKTPMTLFLLNAVVHDSLSADSPYFVCSGDFVVSGGVPHCNTAILVGPGATLTLGTDGFGASGTVFVGDGTRSAQESVGIACYGLLDGGAFGVINDTGSTASPSTWIQNQGIGLALTDGCSANLTASPRFGKALNAMGVCDLSTNFWVIDGTGVYLNNGLTGTPGPNPTRATISNATIECALFGIFLDAFPPETFQGDGNLIQNNLTGVMADLGTFQPTNTTVSHNFVGIETMPSYPGEGADLSGGGNQVSCNGALESGLASMETGPGMNLFMTGTSGTNDPLKVSKTSWNHWDGVAGHTQTWACTDATLTQCTCSGASSCPPSSPDGGASSLPPGADVVYVDAPPGAVDIDDSNGAKATDGCP